MLSRLSRRECLNLLIAGAVAAAGSTALLGSNLLHADDSSNLGMARFSYVPFIKRAPDYYTSVDAERARRLISLEIRKRQTNRHWDCSNYGAVTYRNWKLIDLYDMYDTYSGELLFPVIIGYKGETVQSLESPVVLDEYGLGLRTRSCAMRRVRNRVDSIESEGYAPYKMYTVNKLSDTDYGMRDEYCIGIQGPHLYNLVSYKHFRDVALSRKYRRIGVIARWGFLSASWQHAFHCNRTFDASGITYDRIVSDDVGFITHTDKNQIDAIVVADTWWRLRSYIVQSATVAFGKTDVIQIVSTNTHDTL